MNDHKICMTCRYSAVYPLPYLSECFYLCRVTPLKLVKPTDCCCYYKQCEETKKGEIDGNKNVKSK